MQNKPNACTKICFFCIFYVARFRLDSTWWKWLGKQVGGAHIISETDFKSHLRWHWHFSLILHTDSDASFIVPFQYHFIPSLSFFSLLSACRFVVFFITHDDGKLIWNLNARFGSWGNVFDDRSASALRFVFYGMCYFYLCVCVCVCVCLSLCLYSIISKAWQHFS